MKTGLRSGTRRETAGGSFSQGMGLVLNSSGKYVIPSGSTQIISAIATEDGTADTDFDADPLSPEREVEVLAGGTIAVGDKIEFIMSSTGAGKAQAFSSGTCRGVAKTAAASGERFVMLPTVG